MARMRTIILSTVLRLSGLALMAAAAFAWQALRLDAQIAAVPTMRDYALAAGGCAAASVGAVFTCLGLHLFDRITVASPWRRTGRG